MHPALALALSLVLQGPVPPAPPDAPSLERPSSRLLRFKPTQGTSIGPLRLTVLRNGAPVAESGFGLDLEDALRASPRAAGLARGAPPRLAGGWATSTGGGLLTSFGAAVFLLAAVNPALADHRRLLLSTGLGSMALGLGAFVAGNLVTRSGQGAVFDAVAAYNEDAVDGAAAAGPDAPPAATP